MKRYALPILGLLTLFSCAKEKTQEVVKSYISAHNSHDIEKTLTFYNENIVFELKGVWTKKGLDEMRSLEEWDSSLSSNLKLETISTSQDTVFCRVIENNDWFGAVDITDLIHDPTVFIVNNGKIKKIIVYPSEIIGKKIQTAIGNLYQWSQKTQDSTIYELIQDGQFIYSTETAEKWLDFFSRKNYSDNIN